MSSEDFIDKCVEEYDGLMEQALTCAQNEEFKQVHIIAKNKILSEISSKWKTEMGEKPLPEEIKSTLSQGIESSFRQLTKHFNKSKDMLSAISVQQDAISFYNEEMDKYFRNHPSACPKEIELQHAKISVNAINRAKKESGDSVTAPIVVAVKREIEKRRVFYRNKAEMTYATMLDPAIGIDLGTTMCCVMVFNKGKVETVQNRAQGNRSTTPSYVAYHENGSSTYGWVAKEAAYRFPETTVYDAKRMIGRQWQDEKLQQDILKWPFEFVQVYSKNNDANPQIKTWGRLRFPHEISARLLAQFKIMAEKHLGLPEGSVKKAVITVPAYFSEPQRRATNEAAMCAGLEVLNILSEPTAAAIAYSWERTSDENRIALIYDLGGGTFDVAIAKVRNDKVKILAVGGDTHLGGQDFDQLLMEYCIKKFKTQTGIDLLKGRNTTKTARDEISSILLRVKLQCEKVKEALSTAEEANLEVIGITQGTNMTISINKKKLNKLVHPLVQKTIKIVDRTIADAQSKGINSKADIQDVILVGGSTRMPIVIEKLTEYFDAKELCQNINPDKAVAYGAAVQAASLNKDKGIKRILVDDVTPMSLGIDCSPDAYSVIIYKNSKIPCKCDKMYWTRADNQTMMDVTILQGENEVASKNKILGKFTIEGIPPRPVGEERVKITMTINSMGILQVDAVLLSIGSSNSITITSEKLGMSKHKIEELTRELSGLSWKTETSFSGKKTLP